MFLDDGPYQVYASLCRQPRISRKMSSDLSENYIRKTRRTKSKSSFNQSRNLSSLEMRDTQGKLKQRKLQLPWLKDERHLQEHLASHNRLIFKIERKSLEKRLLHMPFLPKTKELRFDFERLPREKVRSYYITRDTQLVCFSPANLSTAIARAPSSVDQLTYQTSSGKDEARKIVFILKKANFEGLGHHAKSR